jgi:hypothetical protein
MTSVKTDRLFIIHYLTKQVAIKFALTEHHTFYSTSSETSHTTSSSIIEPSNATSLPEPRHLTKSVSVSGPLAKSLDFVDIKVGNRVG